MKSLNLMVSQVLNSRDFIATLDVAPGFYELTINTNIVTGAKFIFALEVTEALWYKLYPCVLVFPWENKVYVSLGETSETGTLQASKIIKNTIALIKTLDK